MRNNNNQQRSSSLLLFLLLCCTVLNRTRFIFVECLLADAVPPLPDCQIFENDPKYIKGSWLPREGHRKEEARRNGELFQCCDDTIEYNSPICDLPNSPQVKDHGCYCRSDYYEKNSWTGQKNPFFYPESSNYEWIPDDCKLTEWNAKEFCDLLMPNIALLVGDSTMSQTHGSLASMIFQSEDITKERAEECLKHVQFSFSDYLVYQPEELRGTNLVGAVRNSLFKANIVFMATGFHYDRMIHESDVTINEKEFANYFFLKLDQDLRLIRSQVVNHFFHNITFIYKTENPPHPHCGSYHKPLHFKQSDANEELLLKESKFHWENSFKLDKKIKEISKQQNISVLSMDPLFLRPEGHVGLSYHTEDCLHYCTPGPLNVFGRIFLQALKNGEFNV